MTTPLRTEIEEASANPLEQLHAYGQSVWYDNISRDMVQDGGLQALIDNSGVLGVTSNPTIFAKAVGESELYDDEIREGIAEGQDAQTIFEHLAVADIQAAADILRPIYDRTKAYDGYISLEVSPTLARDTEGTVAEARRLWSAVDRPNLMIKVPATEQGLPAITSLIGQGINVNVTLIFGLDRYQAVMEAYIKGLDQLMAAQRPVDRVASVASFFVSRVDTLVDKLLTANAKTSGDGAAEAAASLQGKAAIANAKLAYAQFVETFYGQRFAVYREAGAQVQRPLWASTSTKNPSYRDVIYVEELIGQDTVNTMPPATVKAFADHGELRASVTEDVEGAQAVFGQLKAVGIDMAAVTQQLEEEGVKSFADSYQQLLDTISSKREAVAAE